MRKANWLIVSSRLPVTASPDKTSLVPSSGGLVTAIRGIHNGAKVRWIGCAPPGVNRYLWRKISREWRGEEILQPVFFDQALYDSFYNGFCNNLIWPLFHYESNRTAYREENWRSYVEVNERFAQAIADTATDDDLVWIHDFHLFLVPKYLRALRPRLKIGFFLHIPFPSSEIFRQLPHRKELLQALLAADLVGFHDYSYLRHFGSSLLRVLGVDATFRDVTYGGRRTNLGVFPVSIDTKRFAKIARSSSTEAAAMKSKYFTFLGVDRLDYSKGLKLKLDAYRLFLKNNPALAGKTRLVQLAIPTRTEVSAYRHLKEEIELLVGKINGEFGTPNWVPITYIYNQIPTKELAELYRSSDSLLVTSIRDGMNLVTLEYIACQGERNPGVAILSEFTGALSLLNRTVTINPWDIGATAKSMKAAMEMSLEERRERWTTMYKFIEKYDASAWAESFMNQLKRTNSNQSKTKLLEPSRASIKHLLASAKVKTPSELSVVIDYDGTLVPIVDRPEKAILSRDTRMLLHRLSKKVGSLIIISGRTRQFLQSQLTGIDAVIVAEHGSLYWTPKDSDWNFLVSPRKTAWYSSAKKVMGDYANRVPNSFVEKKTFSIAWHFRQSDPEYADYQSHKLHEELEITLANQPVTVIRGNKVIEVRAVEANKGYFLAKFLNGASEIKKSFVFGDDRTDEDMYPEVRGRGYSFRVGVTANTSADFCIPTQTDVPQMLSLLERELGRML
jgi:trehalose 6-phosphate synthase/phosphatase